MSDKKSNFLLPVIGGLVIVAGGVGAYVYFQGSPSGTPNAIGKVIPQQVLFAASISGDSAAWNKLERFQTPEVKKYLDEQLNKFQQDALAKSDLNFNQDIKPWAGDVMFAILPSQPKQSQATPRLLPVSTAIAQAPILPDPSTPNILLAVQIKDSGSASKFFEKVKTKAAGKVVQRDYKGVQISQFKSESGNPTNVAVLGEYSIISPQAKSLEKAIDTFQGQPSFLNNPPAKLELKNPLVQFYMPDFGGSVEQLIALNPNAQTLPPQSLAQLKLVKSVTIGIGVDDDGLRLKGVSSLAPGAIKIDYKNSSGKVISQFPAETFGLITGTNIKARWEQFTKDAAQSPELKQGLDNFRTSLKNPSVGLDLDKDIFGWMDGEFAIAAIASSEGVLAQSGFGPALIFQTSDRPAAEALLKKLDALAKNSGLQVATKDVKGVPVTEWSSPQVPGASLGYGWYEKDAFFFSVGALINLIATKPSNSLDGTPAFKAIAGSLEKNNIGYFYLDMDKTWAWYSSKANPDISKEVKALINTVRGIGATASVPDQTSSKFELLLALKPQK